MDTPPSIRRQYASPPRESSEQRRRRLASRRAAKYRHFKSLANAQQSADGPAALQRQQNAQRQRRRRAELDAAARDRVRAQNRRRQQLRRQSLSDQAREEIREKQRHRQRQRRQTLDDEAREELRERERLRIRRRRQKKQDEEEQERGRVLLLRRNAELPTLLQHPEQRPRLPFGEGGQITLPPPLQVERSFVERMPSLPHLQQVARTQNTLATPSPLFPIPAALSTTATGVSAASSTLSSAVVTAVRPPHPTPIMPSVSLALPTKPLGALPMVAQQQPRTPIVLPPAHRSLPPLPDFLSSREAFNPANAAAADTRPSRRSSSASRALFPSVSDLPVTHTDTQDPDSFFQR